MARKLLALHCAAALLRAGAISVGDKVPDVSLDINFPPEKVSFQSLCKGKKVVLVGLPGAFTPTWSNKQIPGYKAKEAELKSHGVDAVIVYSVNDAAVNYAWSKDQGVLPAGTGSMITIYGDPTSALTKGLGMVLEDTGVMGVLGNPRCKRFSMLIVDGVIKTINVAEGKGDPAGDGAPEVSMVEKMLEDLKAKKDEL